MPEEKHLADLITGGRVKPSAPPVPSQDDVQAKIARAKAAGYSDAEIQAYLSKTGPNAISQGPAPAGPSAISGPPVPKSFIGPQPDSTGFGGLMPEFLENNRWEAPKRSIYSDVADWFNRPGGQGTLDSTPKSPADITNEVVKGAGFAVPTALIAANPVKGLLSLAASEAGGYGGEKIGGHFGHPIAGRVGGSLLGGFAGWNAPGIASRIANFGKLSMRGILMGLLKNAAEEPGAASGAAREAAGGTAATAMPGQAAEAGAGVAGGQAGPGAPKNASELSSTVQKIRSGTGPSTSTSPSIYTPESLASEQGMSTAALGKGAFNLTIPTAQQRIMRLVAEGKVPMGEANPQGFESLGQSTPFPGAQAATQPLASPSPGEAESDIERAIRGAPGINPAIKAIRRHFQNIGRKPGGSL